MAACRVTQRRGCQADRSAASRAARIVSNACAAVPGRSWPASRAQQQLDGGAAAMAERSASEQICGGSSAAARAAPSRHVCRASVRTATRSGWRSACGGGGHDRRRVGWQPTDQRARLAGVASAPLGIRDASVDRSPASSQREAVELPPLWPRRSLPIDAGPAPSRLPMTTTVCHSRPLAAWNVNSSAPTVAAVLGERASRDDPRAERAAVAVGALAQEVEGRRSDLPLGLFVSRHRRPNCRRRRLQHVVRPGPQSARRTRSAAAVAEAACEWTPARDACWRTAHACTPSSAGCEAWRAAHACGRARQPGRWQGGSTVDRRRSGRSARPRRARRQRREPRPSARRSRAETVSPGWPSPRTCVAGGDDLRRASAVGRQADDLDAGQVALDVDQQRWVGTVEPVDRLGRVTDEEQVVAPVDERWSSSYCTGLRSCASSTRT